MIVTSAISHTVSLADNKKTCFAIIRTWFKVTLDFYAIESTTKMTRVLKQLFPVGSCRKSVGLSEACSIYSNSTVLFLGDSNLRALLSGQFDTAGMVL